MTLLKALQDALTHEKTDIQLSYDIGMISRDTAIRRLEDLGLTQAAARNLVDKWDMYAD